MIWFLLSLFPFIVEVVKYKSFISSHFFIDAETVSNILFLIGLVIYFKSKKNWTNFVFLALYPIFTFIHLKFKYLDQIYYPNYVYSHYGIDWGPLGHISQRLIGYFVLTEFVKKYYSTFVLSITNWLKSLYKSSVIVKITVIILAISALLWISETNKIFYDKQLGIMEYVFFNPNKLSKETYIRNKSIGNFYVELSSFKKFINSKFVLIIPPQKSDWPYEGNMPLIRGIIYPDEVVRSTSEINEKQLPRYLLASCGYKFNNTVKCFPSEADLTSKQVFVIDNKGKIVTVVGSFEQIKNSDSIMIVSLN